MSLEKLEPSAITLVHQATVSRDIALQEDMGYKVDMQSLNQYLATHRQPMDVNL